VLKLFFSIVKVYKFFNQSYEGKKIVSTYPESSFGRPTGHQALANFLEYFRNEITKIYQTFKL